MEGGDSATLLVDECAEEFMRIYARSRIRSVEVEAYPVNYDEEISEIDVYVKSVREISIDEVPIIKSIIDVFEGRRLVFYEYENIRKRDDRAILASRLISKGIRSGKSFILVLPSLMSVSLAGNLPEFEGSVVEESLALRVDIEYDNLLYLPGRRDRSIEIVGKANSMASYERVRWLRELAEKEGIIVTREVFLKDNREIFNYVTEKPPEGIYERIPVNKLAGYIIGLSRCMKLPGIREVYRPERVTHYIYAYNVPSRDLEKLSEALKSQEGHIPVPSGLLYNVVYRGSRVVMAELMSRLGLL
ncbi:MAG: hypothetical protein F7C33_01350 [Desulfurococcales archaeon]|nr:hypothetical protein [Desulfurococcales archaeon]